MAGRGDNNKHGSAGRGSSNQSNQGFPAKGKHGKSNHDRKVTGTRPSEESPRTADQDANRNQGLRDRKKKE